MHLYTTVEKSLEGPWRVVLRRGDIDFAVRRKSLFSQQCLDREAFLKQFCITSGAARAQLWRFFRSTSHFISCTTIKLFDPCHALKNEFSPSPGLVCENLWLALLLCCLYFWQVSCHSSNNGRSACLSCPDTCSLSVLDQGCSENSVRYQEAESS